MEIDIILSENEIKQFKKQKMKQKVKDFILGSISLVLFAIFFYELILLAGAEYASLH